LESDENLERWFNEIIDETIHWFGETLGGRYVLFLTRFLMRDAPNIPLATSRLLDFLASSFAEAKLTIENAEEADDITLPSETYTIIIGNAVDRAVVDFLEYYLGEGDALERDARLTVAPHQIEYPEYVAQTRRDMVAIRERWIENGEQIARHITDEALYDLFDEVEEELSEDERAETGEAVEGEGRLRHGGSAASGFIARMMAENRVKNKGAYGPKTDLPRGSMMASPAKFSLKAIANAKQKKGATGTKEYGASPFLLKHFGVDESDNPMFTNYPRYKPKSYRTPVPSAPFQLERRKKNAEGEIEEPKPIGRPASSDTYYNEAMAEFKKDRAEEPRRFGPGKFGQLRYIRQALEKWGKDFAEASNEERRTLVLENPKLLGKFKIGEYKKDTMNRGQRDFYKDIDYDELLALLDGPRATATREVAKIIKNAARKNYEDKV